MQTQTTKANKMQSNAIPGWQYEQEVKQARKANQALRSARKGKKNFWQAAE
jgi:hypothetical protein